MSDLEYKPGFYTVELFIRATIKVHEGELWTEDMLIAHAHEFGAMYDWEIKSEEATR